MADPAGRAIEHGEVAAAVEHVRQGGLLVYPTETVYGIGGLSEGLPLELLRTAKGRDASSPFLVLIPSLESVPELGWTDSALALADVFWPGGLTLLLDDPHSRFGPGVRGPDGRVGVRVSSHPWARALVGRLDGPLVSTSANVPGELPARDAEAARAAAGELGLLDRLHVVDGGTLEPGPPSTLVDCAAATPRVIRAGSIPNEALRAVVPDIEGVEGTGGDEGVHLLFVCTGNTCRSPMAEVVAEAELRQRGWSGSVRSAGTGAFPGDEATTGAQKAAREAGLDLSGHRSTRLTTHLTSWADVILVMSPHHLATAVDMGGEARTWLLKEFATGEEGGSIVDPFGGSDELYEETFAQIRALVQKALDRLEPMARR